MKASPYYAYLGSNASSDQLSCRVLHESSPNVGPPRHALHVRPVGPQHRVFKSHNRATLRQSYLVSRDKEFPKTAAEIRQQEIDYEPEFQEVWSRAWQCARYRNYREKKHGSASVNTDGIRRSNDFAWSDDYERALWKAIVIWQPRGRGRVQSEQDASKDLGRNESIAEYLESKFGGIDIWGFNAEGERKKGRKVVSSHIQVLRGQFDLTKSQSAMHRPPSNPFADVLGYFPAKMVKKKGARTTERQISAHGPTPLYKSTFPLVASNPSYTFKLLDFQMYIRDQLNEGENTPKDVLSHNHGTPLHEITKSRTTSQPTRVSVAEVQDKIDKFPELQALVVGGTHRCSVVFAEASFQLPSKEYLTSRRELCIEQCVSTKRSLAEGCFWSTRTRITAPGIDEVSVMEEITTVTANTYDIKFRSSYWVDLLTRYDAYQRIKPEHGFSDNTSQAHKAHIDEHLRRIRAVQEVLASPKVGNGTFEPAERHMIICWTFKQAECGNAGITQWQELVVPPTLPTMSRDYPSPDASFRAESEYDKGSSMPFDMYNNTPIQQGLDLQQVPSSFDQDEWNSPTRGEAVPYYEATTWPQVDQAQISVPRSFMLPAFDARQQPVLQELYTAQDYLAVGSFDMTPPNSALGPNFAECFDSSTSPEAIQTPVSDEDSQEAVYSQDAEYSQGVSYPQASVGQYLEYEDDHRPLDDETVRIYAPQAQYTHVPLGASFLYDHTMHDFSSFNRVIEDDHAVGGAEYSFQDQVVPILPSQPEAVHESQACIDEDPSLSHLRLTAAFDPNFFSDDQTTIMEAPQSFRVV